MSDFITLACPSCGGSLRITDDVERFACKYCGREHLVRRRVDRSGHAYVDLEPIVAKLTKIDRKMDRHTAELAIQRLRQDRRGLKGRIDEWRDEYSAAKADAGRAVGRLVFAVIFMALGGVGALIAFNATRGDGPAPCIALAGVVIAAISAIVLLVQVVRLPGLNGQVRAAKHRLDRLYDQLDEVEAELAYHERVVRS
jgi:predicted RNA-binding Zn-ribbon protein involved in translation (DUF1610 family)